MNKETQSIIRNLKNTLEGQPWYGRPVLDLLAEAAGTDVYQKPGGKGHSLIELLFHMITWAEFCLTQLENATAEKIKEIENRDWRQIDPAVHTWKKGMEELKSIHDRILSILEKKEDSFLSATVPHREFNFRFMLNGLIQHNIYHLGQIAFVKKMLE